MISYNDMRLAASILGPEVDTDMVLNAAAHIVRLRDQADTWGTELDHIEIVKTVNDLAKKPLFRR